MLDVRDLTDHPAVADRVSAPEASAALAELGFVPLGHVEVPMTEPSSLRQLLVAADGLTVALLWTPDDKEFVTLMSVLEDGTILETEILPGPMLLRRFFKPGYPGLGLRTAQGPQQLTDTVDQHRRLVEARAAGGSRPVLLRERRRVLAVLERKAQIDVSALLGTLGGIFVTLVFALMHVYWLRGLMLQDTLRETLEALAPPGVPFMLVLIAPILSLAVLGVVWPLLFTRISIGRLPTANDLFAGRDAASNPSSPSGTEPASPNCAQWRHSKLLTGVPLPIPPIFVAGLVLAPMVAVFWELAKPAGFAEDHARRYGTDNAIFGDWTELVILLVMTFLVVTVVTIRQRLEIAETEVTFRPMLRAFLRQVRPRSAVLGVWLRGPALGPSRWPANWEVLVALSGDELPLVARVDRRKDRDAAERVALELARRLGVPFEDRSPTR